MVRIQANNLQSKYNKSYHSVAKYPKLVQEVLGKKTNVVLDFDSQKECNQGYNSIWQYLNRHGMKGSVCLAMRNDDVCDIYRLVVSYRMKRKDLLFQNDDAC